MTALGSVNGAAALAAESQIDALTIARPAAHFDGATTRLDDACPPDTHPLGFVERSALRTTATNDPLFDIATFVALIALVRITTFARAELRTVAADAELEVLCHGGAGNQRQARNAHCQRK